MKSILLASASIVAFAGAAAAEDNFVITGSASLGFNDEVKDGFYWEGDVTLTATQAINGNLTATMKFGLNIADNNTGNSDVDVDGNWVITLASDTAALKFGDTDQAAEAHWSGVDGMNADDFAGDNIGDAILYGEVTFGATTAALSYNVTSEEGGAGLEGMQVAVKSSFGNINVWLAYQDDAFVGNGGETLGVGGSTTFGNATITLAYAQNEIEDSIGVGVSAPVGPVTASAYFATNSETGDNFGVGVSYASGPITADLSYDVAGDDDGVFEIEATYAVTEEIKVWAGLLDSGDVYYVAATVDLGPADLLVSFVDDGDDASAADDIGAPELLDGMTAKLSLEF